ncbi:MAG: hypothetical protein HKP58_07795 [Desulfatitalea sp.]|nr:hypothetical protein [Desulfatitalea sp.]NNK00302.1 hypothetical protein [Desulfatitalea sp.]
MMVIDADQQLAFAARLAAQGKHHQAAAEYDRFLHFFPNDPRQREVHLEAGRGMLHAGDGPGAERYFSTVTQGAVRDDLWQSAHFLLTESYLLQGNPHAAVKPLYALLATTAEAKVKDKVYQRLAWIHIDQLDWDGARRILERISPEGRRRFDTQALADRLAQADRLPHKRPALAGALSVLPGAGQMYCGRYEDALAAFMVNGALAWAAYEAFDHDLNALGGILAITGLGFYLGNIYSAVSSAHKFNRAQQEGFSKNVQRQWVIGRRSDPNTTRRLSAAAITIAVRFQF